MMGGCAVECMCHQFFECQCMYVFFFKQKTAYEMRISDWSSDVCSSDLWASWDRSASQPGTGVAIPASQSKRAATGMDDPVAAATSASTDSNRSEERRVRERVCQYV